jgi:general secretion pathway protein C
MARTHNRGASMPQFAARAREDLPQLFGTVLTSQSSHTHDNVLIMLSRFFALLIWGAVALGVAFWGLRWFGKSMTVPPGTASATMDNSLRGDVSKLLAGPAKAVDAVAAPTQQAALAGRLQLLGVVAPRQEGGHAGVALLVLDGKPARAYRLGQAVDGELVVQTISQRQVQIGTQGGPVAVSLDLPLMPAATTGSLPPPTGAISSNAAEAPQANATAAYGAAAARSPGRVSPGAPGMAANSVEGSDAAPGTEARNGSVTLRGSSPRMRRRGAASSPPGDNPETSTAL